MIVMDRVKGRLGSEHSAEVIGIGHGSDRWVRLDTNRSTTALNWINLGVRLSPLSRI